MFLNFSSFLSSSSCNTTAAVLSNNQIQILNGTTGIRERQTIIPITRTIKENNHKSNKKSKKGFGGLRGSSSTSTLEPTKLARGRARLGATTAMLPPAGGDIAKTGERSSSIGNLHSSIPMSTLLVSEWWNDRDAIVLGWSDGCIEVTETKQGGRRLKLLSDKTQSGIAITSVCVAKLSCTSGDRAVAANGGNMNEATNVPQRLAEEAWSNNEVVSSMTVHAPTSELAGPWGGPVRFSKSKKRKLDGKQKLINCLESKYTIIVGNSQGTLCIWSPRLSRLVSSNHGHSGAIIGVIHMPMRTTTDPTTTTGNNETTNHSVTSRIQACSPSPSRNCIVTGSIDGVIKVWSVSRAGKLKQISFFLAQPQLSGNTNTNSSTSTNGAGSRRSALTQIMVIPNTSILICGFDEGTVQAWELDTESRINVDAQQLEAKIPFWNRNQHSQKVTAIRKSEHTERFATSSLDATIVIWELTTRRRPSSSLLDDRGANGGANNGTNNGANGLILHITPLQAFSVDSPVIDLHFVGDGGALLAVLSGRLVWLDGTLRTVMDSRKSQLKNEETKQEVLRQQYWNGQQNEDDSSGKTDANSTPIQVQEVQDQETEQEKEEEEEQWPESDDDSSSSSSSEDEIVEEKIESKTDAFPYSGYQPNKYQKPRSVSIGSTDASENPPVAFFGFGDRSDINASASIPSRHSPPPKEITQSQSQSQLQSQSQAQNTYHNEHGTRDRLDSYSNQHYDPSTGSIDSPTFFALLPEMTAEFVPRTRGSLRPFTTESNSSEIEQSIDESNLIQQQHLQAQQHGSISSSSILPHNTSLTSPTSPTSTHYYPTSPTQSTVVPISGRPLPDMSYHTHDSQTTLIFQLLEREMTSLDESEDGKISLNDIPRLLMSMQQTSRDDVQSNPVLKYPLWLIWELYQRLIRWKLTVGDATRNVVKIPTVSQDLKRIQLKCDTTKVDLNTTRLLFTTLLAYSKRHGEMYENKKLLKTSNYLKGSGRNKNIKNIVKYNSIGEKIIQKRNINVSEMVSFRQMFLNMKSRDQRARTASREQWDQMLGIHAQIDIGIEGLCRVPAVRWHIIPHNALSILEQFGQSLVGLSYKEVSHWPWPPLPEVFIKLHTLQLKTLPKKDRDQFVLPTFDEVVTMPLHVVLEIIKQILNDKEADDMVQDRQGHPRQGLCMFIYEWHLQHFGLPILVAKKVVSFLRSLLEYREIPVCRTIARFCKVLGPIPLSETKYGNTDKHASSSFNLYLDAKQWFIARDIATRKCFDEPLGNLMGMEPSRLDLSKTLVSATSTAHYKVNLVTTYRAFECIRALFPTSLPLVQHIEGSLVHLPSMSDPENPTLRLIEMELVLETFLQSYGSWVSKGGAPSTASSIDSSARGSTSGSISSISSMESNSSSINVPHVFGSSSSNEGEGEGKGNNKDPTNQAFVVSAVKRLLDDMMLVDEKENNGSRSGSILPSTFEDTLSQSAIWGEQIISPSLLRIILKEFEREGTIAYLEFWSQLYQHVTTNNVKPLHVSKENGTVILPLSVLDSVRRKTTKKEIITQKKAVYSNMISTGGHGKSTVPIPLKSLTDRMSAMVPLFSTNLNMDMTSTTNISTSSIFHNGTIEISREDQIEMTPGISRAPGRLERSDKLKINKVLDHGEHSRHALKPPPRKKHPSSQKRMNMTLLHHHSVDRIRDNQLHSEQREHTSSLSMVDLSTWSDQPHQQQQQQQQQQPVQMPSPTKTSSQQQQKRPQQRSALLDSSHLSNNVVDQISRAVTPSLHLRARRAIKNCTIIESDQREAALFSIDRHRNVSSYMLTLQLLLEDADAQQIRMSEPLNKQNILQEIEIRTLTKVISGAYKIPSNKRKAAKSVLSTATTKAEAVSIEIALLSGSEPIDIIRASDDVLHTAVTIHIDEQLRSRILKSIEKGGNIINAFVPQKRKRAVQQLIEARSTSSLLSIVYQLLLHGFNDAASPTSFDRVDEEGTFSERSKSLLITTVRSIPNNLMSELQRETTITALAEASTMTEACVLLITVLEGQPNEAIFEQARTIKDNISERVEHIRTASRQSSRIHLNMSPPPSREREIQSSRPNSRSSEVSSRLYPDTYKSGPPQWDSAQPRPKTPYSPPTTPTATQHREKTKRHTEKNKGMEFNQQNQPTEELHSEETGTQRNKRQPHHNAIRSNSAEGGKRGTKKNLSSSSSAPKSKTSATIDTTKDNNSNENVPVVVQTPVIQNSVEKPLEETPPKTPTQEVEQELNKAIERSQSNVEKESTARAKRDARRAEKEAAIRAEINNAHEINKNVMTKTKQINAERAAELEHMDTSEIDAKSMAINVEEKVRAEMLIERKEREKVAQLQKEKEDQERIVAQEKAMAEQKLAEEAKKVAKKEAKAAKKAEKLRLEQEEKEKLRMKKKQKEDLKKEKSEAKAKAIQDKATAKMVAKEAKAAEKNRKLEEAERLIAAAEQKHEAEVLAEEKENELKLQMEAEKKIKNDMRRDNIEKMEQEKLKKETEDQLILEELQKKEELATFADKIKVEEEQKQLERAEKAKLEAEQERNALSKKQFEEDDNNKNSLDDAAPAVETKEIEKIVVEKEREEKEVMEVVVQEEKKEEEKNEKEIKEEKKQTDAVDVVEVVDVAEQEEQEQEEVIKDVPVVPVPVAINDDINDDTQNVEIEDTKEMNTAIPETEPQPEPSTEPSTEPSSELEQTIESTIESTTEPTPTPEPSHFLDHANQLVEELEHATQKYNHDHEEAEKATAEAALLNTETTEEPEENWYNAFQALCVSDEEESDGMDSGNDEFGLGAVSQAQFVANEAKRHAMEVLQNAKDAKQAMLSSREKALADKAAKEAEQKAIEMENELKKILKERRKREIKKQKSKSNKPGPRKREMSMHGLVPEYGLTFSDNIQFDPFQLMKGPTSIPPWEDADADADSSDGYNSEEEKEEMNEWKIQRNRVIQNSGKNKLKSMMNDIVEDILPEGWNTAPRMFKLEQPTWRPWFRRQEEDLLHEVKVVEEQELDLMAKRLAEQKAALLAGENIDENEAEEKKGKAERAKGHWGKIRVHVKTKWRMSKLLRKARMKTTAVRPCISGEPINDTIPKGFTKDDDLSCFKYYSLHIDSEHSIITVNITSTQGDPDLYVSNHILPSTVDYTWKVNTIGKCRLVIFPSDPNFVTGQYLIGVYSHVPARFSVNVDVSGGAYSSESVRNVERLTSKFNTVAEGFVVKRVFKDKPKSKVKVKQIVRTSKEKAEAYALEIATSESRLIELRKEVQKKVNKISKKRLKSISKLEKVLDRSMYKREMLADQFIIEQENHALDYVSTSDDVEDSEDEDEENELHEDDATDDAMAQRDHQGLRMYPGETAENMDELQMNTHTNDNVPPTQSISEILKILEREESGSEEEDEEDVPNFDEEQQSDALRATITDPISLWRPGMKLSKPTRYGFEPKNTFNVEIKDVPTKVQQYEMAKLDESFKPKISKEMKS